MDVNADDRPLDQSSDNPKNKCHCETQVLFLRRGNLQLEINSIVILFKMEIYDILSDFSSEPK